MSVVEEYITKIKDTWFIYEPALFMVLCSFPVEYSTKTDNIMTGARNIKVNEDYFSDKSYEVFEDHLRLECIRILLEHPFKRSLPVPMIAYIASNLLIGSTCEFENIDFPKLDERFVYQSYEDIYKFLIDKVNEKEVQGPSCESNGGGGTCSGDTSGGGSDGEYDYESRLPDKYKKPFGNGDAKKNSSEWGYDELSKALVGKIKQKIAATNSWGSLPSDLVSVIMAEEAPEYNYKTAIRRFRKNVISSDVELTRMKPNRRYGYEQMGKKRSYKSSILLVCDTSGSMSDYSIGKFCGFVNRFFAYGISDIDTVTYDVSVLDETLHSIKQKVKFIKTASRGGTDISDILDFVNKRSKKKYTGVIVFTDGCFAFDKDKWEKDIGNVKYLFCIINEHWFNNFNKEKDRRIESSYVQL